LDGGHAGRELRHPLTVTVATRTLVLASVVLALGCSGRQGPKQPGATGTAIDFEALEYVPGKAPPGWTPAETDGNGTPAVWTIEVDGGAPAGPKVLSVRTANIEKTFNLLVFDALSASDVETDVWIKPGTGTDDQGGGLIFRVQDAMNYYLARWNPLEKNVRAYVVRDAKRTTLGSADVEPVSGWHRLGVRMTGAAIEVAFDGRPVLSVSDDKLAGPGRLGLWTKADASSAFDAFTIRPSR
jgi:hypothetical protein